jgi:hypothetical protein
MINITEERNKDLYYDLEKCLDFCKSIENEQYNDFTYYHMFWNVGLQPNEKHELPIKSYLATQNLKNTKLILWSNIDLRENKHIKPYLDRIEFRIYDPIKEAINTPLDGKLDILTANDERNWSKGDLFRILTLHNYGGVYVDFDVVFLRDFAPLLEQEFMYKWGLEKEMINGAIMRMFKNSELSVNLLNEIANGPAYYNSTMWSTVLYEKVYNYNKSWTIFPSGFFNSEWQDFKFNNPHSNESFQPFKKNNFDLYEGAFSWHWHNKWEDTIEEESKFDTINKIMNEKLKSKI